MDDLEINLKIPDLWQQDAIRALKNGRDVIVDAPTGAGKTYIFEMFVESGLKGQAIYTVPTRALANDKLLEWRAKGWNVGITTGDVSDNLDAPVIVATLETQKGRFLRGDGPRYLVIDEYQMLSDPTRGVNYELIIALAPEDTQLLMMSGTVGNPEQITAWLKRLGRKAELITHKVRPVPLDEVHLEALPGSNRDKIRGYWPLHISRALRNGMGPVLIFAPRRKASEELARRISAELDINDPLVLTPEQKKLAGKQLTGLLKNRIAYHHSGLSYQQRAGLIEPLAKNGQLRVVVATTGLSAGINFSMRSVLVTDREYRKNEQSHLVRPDELLQMFGRAGRRGLDVRGYILMAPGKPRLSEGRPLKVKRTNQVEWPTLIAVMQAAIEGGENPVTAATELSRRLFSEQRVPLGLRELVEKFKNDTRTTSHPTTNGLRKKTVTEMLNSSGKWERQRAPQRSRLGDVLVFQKNQWRPALECADPLDKVKVGRMYKTDFEGVSRYGRELALAHIAESDKDGELVLVKWLFKQLRSKGRKKIRRNHWSIDRLEKEIVPILPELTEGGRMAEMTEYNGTISARLDYSEAEVFAYADSDGGRLLNPPVRETSAGNDLSFREIMEESSEKKLPTSPAAQWLKLGLIDRRCHPTQRGIIFSFFNHGEGLAIAAALEDTSYAVDELIYDLANLRAGHRFEEHEAYSGRLGQICRLTYRGATCSGYLEKGVPPDYGDGAAEVLATVASEPGSKARLLREDLRTGDIERIGLEWRSLLNQIAHAPQYDWERWEDLQDKALKILESEAPPPVFTGLPILTKAQRHRYQDRFSA